MTDLISIEGLRFRYPDLPQDNRDTLHGIDLHIHEGEYLAVVGANGSGKSTLARMMNALLLPDQGAVKILGYDTKKPVHLPAIRKTVGMVFQFPEDQIFSSTIEEDVAFGLENFGWEYESMHRRVKEILGELGLWEIRQRPSYLLSAGQTQRLALAGVLAIRPRCIIFDEATSMLDPLGRQIVLLQMRNLHLDGNTIIHITHSMEEAAQATRVIVLLDGGIVYDGTPSELFSGRYDLAAWRLEYPLEMQIIQAFQTAGLSVPDERNNLQETARWMSQHLHVEQKQSITGELQKSNPFEIEVDQLGHIYLEGTPYQTRALRDIHLAVAKSSCHGLIGVTGSGKSTLLQHLNGLLRPQTGTVRIGPYDTTDRDLSLRELVQYSGLVMQNPEVQFFEEYVGDEIAYGPKTVKMNGSLSERVRLAMGQVGLDFATFKDRQLYSLSGGEKRKVALASILALQPKVLLLDEPTAGLDPSTHQDILRVFKQMVVEGTTIVVSSHNMEDIAAMTASVTVMADGESIADGPSREILGDEIGMEEHQMIPPIASRFAQLLRENGLKLPNRVATSPQLIAELGGKIPE
jgi:energy-coupling factor transport system ATP-binding protein